MRTLCRAAFLLLIASAAIAADQSPDVKAARAVFQANLAAIAHHDRDAYLSYYLHSDRLVRGGESGFTTGFDDFAKQAGSGWPDQFDASDLHLTEVQPGVVYGTYRYRVRYGTKEQSGISERLFINTPQGWKIAVTGAIDTPPGTAAPPRAIVGATVIDGRGGAPAKANIVMRNGKIDCVGTCDIPDGLMVVNGSGMWVTPGLIDAHVHFSQTGWADGRPDSIDVRGTHPYEVTLADNKANAERYGRSYVCSGVTSVFDVGGYTWTLLLHDRFENNSGVPHVEAAGPLLSTLDHWLNLPAERQFIHLKDAATGKSGVDYLASAGSKAIKVWWIVRPPELTVDSAFPWVQAAGDEAHKLGLPLIVHATGLAEAKASLRAGANLLVHSVEDLPVDAEFIDLAKKNGAMLIPTLTVLDGYARMYRGVADRKAPAIDDPNGCVDPLTRAKVAETATLDPKLAPPERAARLESRVATFSKVTRANLKTLVDAGIPIATGTDAGNPLTLHGPAIYAEMEAMQAAGMTPMQVIVASTATAARVMRLDKQVGTIEKGKDADLVLLAADPAQDVFAFRKVKFVVRSGVVRSTDDLHALAQNPQR